MKTKKTKTNNVGGASELDEDNGSILEGPIFKEGIKHFSPLDLVRFELAQAKVLDAQKDIRIAQMDIDQLKINFERAAKVLQDRQAAAIMNLRTHDQALMALRSEIEKIYKVDINKITYDDTSGKIMMPPEPVPPEQN
jgi:hypothetical protein